MPKTITATAHIEMVTRRLRENSMGPMTFPRSGDQLRRVRLLRVSRPDASDVGITLMADPSLEASLACDDHLLPDVDAGDRLDAAVLFQAERHRALSPPLGTRHAVIETPYGEIGIELFGDDATQTVARFIHLSETGFYNDLTFHRVVPNFVIQGGDPRGDGWGDAGYYIRSEFNAHRYGEGYVEFGFTGGQPSATSPSGTW